MRKQRKYICVCIYICMSLTVSCIYIYIYVYIYIHTYTYIYIHTHTHTFIHIYIHKCIHTCVEMYTATVKLLQSCLTLQPHPWDSPDKITGVGCHFLLQCIKVKSESEVAQSCLTLRDPMDCRLPCSSVHGIF